MTTIPSITSIDRSVLARSFNLTIPSIQASRETIAFMKTIQKNPQADPSVIEIDLDLKGQLKNLQNLQAKLTAAETYAETTPPPSVGQALVKIMLFLVLLPFIITVALIVVLICPPCAFAPLLEEREDRKSLEKEVSRLTPILQKNILAAANYLQENSSTIIENLGEKIKNLGETINQLEQQPLHLIHPPLTPYEISRKMQDLQAIKRELEGPGQTMLRQLTSPHPGYPPTATTYTYL